MRIRILQRSVFDTDGRLWTAGTPVRGAEAQHYDDSPEILIVFEAFVSGEWFKAKTFDPFYTGAADEETRSHMEVT